MEDFDYRVVKHPRARRIKARVSPQDGVTITVPSRVSRRELVAAVAQMQPWIQARVKELEARRAELLASDELTVLGVKYRLAELVQQLEVSTGNKAHQSADVTSLLTKWIKAQARDEFGSRLAADAARAGVEVRKLRVTDTKTRWGSCSKSTGTISLSWRLLLAPREVMEYVIWHEVCHLIEPNHGPKFWQLVQQGRPNFRAEADWLKRFGNDLHLLV